MANPYAAGAGAGTIMANVRGDIGNDDNSPQGRLDETGLTTAEVTRRLLAYTRPHMASLVASFIASAVSVVLQLYVSIVVGRAIDCMVSAGGVDFPALMPLLRGLALIVVGAAVTQWLSGYCTNRLTYKTVRDLRVDAFARLRDLPLSFVDARSHGDLLSRVVNDADQVGDGLLQGLTQLFAGVVTIVGTLAFMFSISVPVGLVVVVVTPASMLVAWLIARYSAKSFKDQQALQGSLGGYVEEMVGSQKLVCAFAYGDRAQAGFDDINQRLLRVGEHAQFTSSLSNPATRVVNNVTYAVVAVVGCICVISGWPSVLTVGQVQTFLSYANQYMKPFNEISNVVTQIQTAYASARRLFALIDAPAQSADPAEPEVDDSPQGALEFSRVGFSYAPDRPLLHDISFSAEPGQTIALVGPTGCGKTTLINLLLRFYDVDAGQILVDGHDTSRMRRDDLRSLFGMVLQDTWLFRGTVRENIAYGTPDATFDGVVAAAKRAHAHKFIEQLPQGYETLLGEDGGSLSQGQRQLLCIARVMLADPTILLLDEATSSIDTRTESQVQDAFDRMMEGRTSLVVAHRLSTVRDADCILVMRDGRIIERGTHDGLLRRGGFYAELYESQFEGTR
ncbi:MAG: ABC transporter ATP-binding protein/permease [Coriobacteriaceae bacterium]|uniref:ABC transporter ATP-binding protein n=1 Tax=Tractidigestivibacter sp. TaxID=2847320 RepID=UPI002A7EF5EA|nr:ABC transporter ATP-binding protein [Tractidigestivibacter sp.]MCI6274560.1 ABC transporter ATP-binding protein/permease [Coriobacteriaceae bacterium]MCI7437657.1 ABC transporter ATP-binding protein/permease [Coriobacteriaceae bacterium]MDD7583220.1 ABC transporter ATP-binding protein [Coriobacteriaceae bacterium]MDY4534321.1 ABC transporter ATP-binding protein [Tractidigestivibacter sp.]MDY5272433.1 ABC transporter ATP-binding protein [Tractidigestivibacter sp.]